MSPTLTQMLRRAIRSTGFDVVRYKPPSTPRDSLRERYPDFSDTDIETIVAVQPYSLTSPERIQMLIEATKYVCENSLDGAFVECGVWKGGSMMAIARTLLSLGKTRDLYLFDTFEGMTDPTGADVTWDGSSANTVLSQSSKSDPYSYWCAAPLEGVKAVMSSTDYPRERLHYVVGGVEDTIPREAPAKIALLRLDTDFYESTRHELEHLFPRLARGGVLIIDDYGHWKGARKAVDEYFSAHPEIGPLCRVDYTGRIAVRL